MWIVLFGPHHTALARRLMLMLELHCYHPPRKSLTFTGEALPWEILLIVKISLFSLSLHVASTTEKKLKITTNTQKKNFNNKPQLHLSKRSPAPCTINRSSFWSHITTKSSFPRSCSMGQGSEFNREQSKAMASSLSLNMCRKVKLQRLAAPIWDGFSSRRK